VFDKVLIVDKTHPLIPLCRIAGVDMTRIQPVRRRLIIGVASVFIAAGALAGCSAHAETPTAVPATATAAPTGPVINLSSLMFHPTTITVKVGDTITWRNDEAITHTVTSGRFVGIDKTTGLRSSQQPDGTFNAKLAGKGKTFGFTFTKPGTYTYYCDIHQGMNATIKVVGASTSTDGEQK
jgi:plastocyanin